VTKDYRIWALRVAWLALPFTAENMFDNALSASTRSVQITATIGLWFLWALGLLMSLVPLSSLLTPFRVLAAMNVVIVIWGAIESPASLLGIVTLCLSGCFFVLAFTPQVGFWHVNGSSYGDEVRIPLKPPGAMLLGPIPISSSGIVVTLISTPVLLADKQWLAGCLIAGFGGVCSFVAFRSLHALTQRWLVFVPAGVVIHDPLLLGDPFLVKRNGIRSIHLALVGSDAEDLTMSSLGHAIEVELHQEAEIAVRKGPKAEPILLNVISFTVSASLLSSVFSEAQRRSIPTA